MKKDKKTKKGFTLIELLAVIIILTVVAIISVPIILKIINDAKKASLETEYTYIENAAELYVKNEYGGVIDEELQIPLTSLKEYIDNYKGDYEDEYVVVTDLGSYLSYYYSGREDNPYDNVETLKSLIENDTAHIVKNLVVNGKTVNKVVGTKDEQSTMNNYVWYSGYLWQVLETNEDGIKMVMAYAVTSISFGTNNNYATSYVRKWLNDVSDDVINYPNVLDRANSGLFYNNLSRKDLLVDTSICFDALNDVVEDTSLTMSNGTSTRLVSFTKISECENVIYDKVGIMTVEDYAYAYDGTLNEYAHTSTAIADETKRKKGGLMGYNFTDNDDLTWLATPYSSSSYVWGSQYYNPGFISKTNMAVSGNGRSVRPVITIKDTVKIAEGSGTKNDPYIIEDIETLSKGAELTYATVGDFITISESENPYETNSSVKENVLYRIIETDEDYIKVERYEVLTNLPTTIAISGKYTPFYSYYDASVDSSNWCYYDSISKIYYYENCLDHNVLNNDSSGDFTINNGQSIAYFLNDADNSFYSWINEAYQELILERNFDLIVSGVTKDATTTRLVDEDNQNSLVYPSNNYDGTYTGKIILPSWGDILSGNDLNFNYWLNNRWYNNRYYASFINGSGNGQGYYTTHASTAIRPVFYLNSSVKVLSGSGTKNNPYTLIVAS
ncbi:MAG: type II secretion system protein [Bacilli bacterium]|nr:type II secretion system protein [Bacilli bacterium]